MKGVRVDPRADGQPSMRVSEPGLTGNPIHLSVTSARTQIHAALMSLTPSAFKITAHAAHTPTLPRSYPTHTLI